MQETWTLTQRELRAYFDSPAAYVLLTVFLIVAGRFFATSLFRETVASLRSAFNTAPSISISSVPATTLSTFAEERRAGTLDLPLSLPISDAHVIADTLLSV